MLLKLTIIAVFAALLISLASGLVFLVADQGNRRRRTLHALGVRVALATLLLVLVTYGVLTGQLRSQAPWSAGYQQTQGDSD